MSTRNPDSTRYIARFDYKHTRGFQVRLSAPRTKDGEPFTMFFSDRMFGGKDKALAIAIRERDARLKKAVPRTGPIPRGARVGGSCPTGIPGVKLLVSTRQGPPYYEWRATWREPTPDGSEIKTRARSFAVNAHGYEEGWRKACQVRREKAGVPVPAIPAPPLRSLLKAMRTR
jgi:hypothetical protein